MLQCYICHKSIKRHEYTRHVASHLAGNVTGAESLDPWPDPALYAFSNESVNYNYPATASPAPSTPLRTGAYNSQGHIDNRRQETPEEPSEPLNAFQIWRKHYAPNSPKYTTIDGGKTVSDSEVRQAAKVLRSTSKEEIVRIVKDFKGFTSNDDQRTCLELVRKFPIFPGLVAYTYTHLIMCPRHGWPGWFYKDDWADRVSELKRLAELWSKYEDAWCILSCDALKDALLKILRATTVGRGEHKCNSALLNGAMVLKHDILNLASLAVICITGERKQDILGGPGGHVGKLIELFHDLLESNVGLEECYRRCFLNVIIPFSKESGFCPRSLYIPEGTITELKWVAKGGFGQVSKGKLDSRLVAVKALTRKTTSLPGYRKLLSEEAIVWWYLSHPNCLPLHGIYVMPEEGENIRFGLVSPWMDQGTLSDYLKRNPSANRTELILDVLRGLRYLHTLEPHVAHRDIKPANILITRKGRACLADFGLASVFDTIDSLHTDASRVYIAGTRHYMAPEMFDAATNEQKRHVNKRACDMYALGCTIYQVYTGILAPVGDRSEFLADKISPDMWSFVENLRDHEPLKRLTAEMALDWMEVKATQEGIDLSLAPLIDEEELGRKRETDNLWSISL